MVKLFMDGATLEQMANIGCDGFTTNPTLCKNHNVKNYQEYALLANALTNGRPISFEVLADDSEGIYKQAHTIATWGNNVFVKVPCMMTNGLDTYNIIRQLANEGIKLNITAVFTLQ